MAKKGTTLKSVKRATDIVELIMQREGVGVSELSNELNLAPSTVHGYLSTLHDQGYLIKENDEYQIGLKFLRYGEYSRTRKEGYRLAEQMVNELAEETNERSQFVVEEFGWGVFLYRESGTHGVETGSEVGKRVHLHSNAAGKAILAHLPKERVEHIIERVGLPAMTPYTITDESELLDRLQTIQNRGYALNRNESVEGLHAVGVPVQTEEDGVLGALSVSGPSHRLKDEYLTEEIPDLLLGTANELELKISYS